MPENLIFALACLIKLYKTDMANDDKDVMEFMKNASVEEILANEKLWDTDLTFLKEEILKYVD